MPPEPDDSGAQLEQLVFQCLEASDPEAALAAVARDHPDSVDRVRAALASIQELTLGGPLADAPPLPRRIGPFELVRRIGAGGMGVVYAARDGELDREIAVKLIRPDQIGVDEAKARFRREVAAVARLQHPGIVTIHTAGEDQGIPYCGMELVEGETLAEILTRLRGTPFAMLAGTELLGTSREPASSSYRVSRVSSAAGSTTASARVTSRWVDACVRVARMVADALEHAHQRGVVHRDVKPSNVILDAHGRARLLDFGLAHLQEGQDLTQSTAQLGSLPYMPPEVIEGRVAEYGPAQDVYSLGVMLYELMTLESPFLAPTAGETRRRIAAAQPRRPRLIHRQISWDAETVCLVAMDPDPRRRYATAQACADDLARVLSRQPIAARRPGALLRSWRLAQRHSAWAVGLSLGFLAFVVAPLVFAFYSAAMRDAADRSADKLAHRNKQFEMLEHVVRLDDTRQSLAALPGWPDRAAVLRAWLEGEWATFAEALPEIEAVVAEQAQRAAAGQPAAGADRFLHERLAILLEEAGELERTEVEALRQRIAWAERLPELTDRDPSVSRRWHDAAAALHTADGVTASALYQCEPPLELRPQLGLVPIGRNPATGLWEFYHLRSAADPTAIPTHDPENGDLEVDGDTGIVFVLLPGGSFAMGAQAIDPTGRNYDPLAAPTEAPVHDVALAPFFLARHELTQGQWMRLHGGANPSVHGPGHGDVGGAATRAHPVEGLSWHACEALGPRFGLVLPTEAQWEYACRAGTVTPWWTGTERESIRDAANLCDATVANAGLKWEPVERWLSDGHVIHAPVASLRGNPFGLHHVLGNVSEWCADPVLTYGRAAPRPGDGLRSVDRETRSRTLRGGNCQTTALWARSAARNPVPPRLAGTYFGVRPARRLEDDNER